MSYGLLSTGFVEKPVTVIAQEIADAQRASPALGAEWDTSVESPVGQMNTIVAAQLASAWEAVGVVYRSRSPREASYAGLDAVCSLTGTTRLPATKCTVTLTVTLGAGVTLPAGSVAHVAGQPANRWVTLAAATNSGGSPATVNVDAEAEAAGVFVANAGTITSIATPRTGWTAVTNTYDAAAGTAAETDPVLRLRRERELTAGGTSPPDAIRAALLRVDGVSSAVLSINDTDAYVLDQPPHSVRAIVQGGTDAAVALALWRAVAGGIQTYGGLAGDSTTVEETVTDAGGFSRTVRFTRPSTVNAYATAYVVVDSATYVGDDALKLAIANITTAQLAGAPLRMSAAIRAALTVAGVVDCSEVAFGRASDAQVAANLGASPYEVLKLAAGRITIVRLAA